MQVLVFVATVLGASYFLIFQPESPIALILFALMPLSWLGLFGLRYWTERSNRKKEEDHHEKKVDRQKKVFHDPHDLLEKENFKE